MVQLLEGSFRNLNVFNLFLLGQPLLDPTTKKISSIWLTPPTTNVPQPAPVKATSYGKYSRKDVTVGHIHLEVAENGAIIQLTKDTRVVAEIDNGPTVVGEHHKLSDGIWYILTNSENAILEVDTSIHTDWEPTARTGARLKKYILVKRPL
jgi:hypothetical protein